MAIVNNEHSITKSGIGIGQPILVQGGIDGNYAVLAHQIDWGKSLFNNKEFGRNTQDLLNEIEEMSIPIISYCIIEKAIQCFKFLLSNVQCNSSNKAVDNWGVFSVPTFPEMPTSETPYPTVTVTPTHTPTVTVTVTPTPTVSPTVSPTVTVTVSPTVTMTTSPTT